ncbi:MAG: hypothetical protein K2M94_06535 [Paramuribaculum sp.]|nr:hypothetical protein [Paramuribaculum sp.]
MMPSAPATPRWMIWVILLVSLPVFQFPMLLSSLPVDSPNKVLVWMYPFYVVVAAYLAYQCYPQRRALAWILLALMVLSHIAVYMLVNSSL